MLIYDDLLGHHDKVQEAIDFIKMFDPSKKLDEVYYVAYSGGKDSDCIRILMELAGVKYDLVHNHTTMDAPETVYYVRSIPGIQIEYPEMNIHQLIVKKHMPPTRIVRYCCSALKERGGSGRLVVTGVRWAESIRRKKTRGFLEVQGNTVKEKIMLNNDNDDSRSLFDHCVAKHKRVFNPIIDWSDDDVWEFLRYYCCDSNPLYKCGYKRIGCVGCPMSYHRKEDFERYPKYKENYIKTFDRMINSEFYETHPKSWNSGEDVFDWWVSDKPKKIVMEPNQLSFDDDFEF